MLITAWLKKINFYVSYTAWIDVCPKRKTAYLFDNILLQIVSDTCGVNKHLYVYTFQNDDICQKWFTW